MQTGPSASFQALWIDLRYSTKQTKRSIQMGLDDRGYGSRFDADFTSNDYLRTSKSAKETIGSEVTASLRAGLVTRMVMPQCPHIRLEVDSNVMEIAFLRKDISRKLSNF